MKGHVLLLSGVPGVGKSTVLRKVKQLLGQSPLRGFLTDEVRNARGQRLGFQIESIDGRSARLADVSSRSPDRVGRYGVDVAALERVAVPALALDERAVYLVDEIGKMECLSSAFVEAVVGLLDSDRPLIATVAQRGAGFIADVKRDPGAELWQVTRENRDELPARVVSWLGDL
ncbi:MAG TPA: nucleoside-triphosphatase [Myxococcaceae bacterium]|nr:nucleoside-triphosphatase [Myxococcaceae bacterium]